MDVDVSAVLCREPAMEPFEVMTSESQERMLAIVTPEAIDEVLALCNRWEVSATVIGRVTAAESTRAGRLRVLDGFDGPVLADVPAASLHDDAPVYDRPLSAPATRASAPDDAVAPTAGDLLDLLCDTSWIWRQYDHQLFLNTVVGPGGDAVLLRLKHPTTGADTGRGLAVTTDGNHRWCAADPRAGTALVVAEAVLNLACVGARPIAVVNCLNFGNPEHPEVMWQLSEAVDGLAGACRAFGLPVIGGNVSLYNETGGTDIHPTPVVGVLGLVDRLDNRPPGPALVDGDRVLLVGPSSSGGLGGSAWAWRRGEQGGVLPPLDTAVHTAVAALVRGLVADGVVSGVHDVATGGLALAVSEMAVASGVGARIAAPGDDVFGEAPSRVVLSVPEGAVAEVRSRATERGVELIDVGAAGGGRITIDRVGGAAIDLGLDDVSAVWRDRLPAALGAGVAQG